MAWVAAPPMEIRTASRVSVDRLKDSAQATVTPDSSSAWEKRCWFQRAGSGSQIVDACWMGVGFRRQQGPRQILARSGFALDFLHELFCCSATYPLFGQR